MDVQKKAETICQINDLFKLNRSIRKKMEQLSGEEVEAFKKNLNFRFESLGDEYLEEELKKIKNENKKLLVALEEKLHKDNEVNEEIVEKKKMWKRIFNK